MYLIAVIDRHQEQCYLVDKATYRWIVHESGVLPRWLEEQAKTARDGNNLPIDLDGEDAEDRAEAAMWLFDRHTSLASLANYLSKRPDVSIMGGFVAYIGDRVAHLT